jgi:heme/copper-type cytochrome/quinol oxidase subunit 4
MSDDSKDRLLNFVAAILITFCVIGIVWIMINLLCAGCLFE